MKKEILKAVLIKQGKGVLDKIEKAKESAKPAIKKRVGKIAKDLCDWAENS